MKATDFDEREVRVASRWRAVCASLALVLAACGGGAADPPPDKLTERVSHN